MGIYLFIYTRRFPIPYNVLLYVYYLTIEIDIILNEFISIYFDRSMRVMLARNDWSKKRNQ